MHRKFIAFVAAAALSITSFSATPVRADPDDLAKVLVGALGLAALGAIIKKNNDKKDEERERRAERERIEHQQQVWRNHNGTDHVSRGYVTPQTGYGYVQPRPLPWDVERKLLPGQCLESHKTQTGRVRMFGYGCLQKNYRNVQDLPGHCRVSVRQRNGERYGYDAACLRDRGYQLARR